MIVKPNVATEFPAWMGWTPGCRVEGSFQGKATVDNDNGTFTFQQPGSAQFLVYNRGTANQLDVTCEGEAPAPAQITHIEVAEVAIGEDGVAGIGGAAVIETPEEPAGEPASAATETTGGEPAGEPAEPAAEVAAETTVTDRPRRRGFAAYAQREDDAAGS